MSPELLEPDLFGFKDSRPTKKSDCYALGMVILEVLSGRAPFSRYNRFTVMRKVVEGEHPERPQAEGAWFKGGLWEILERCWSPQPKDRPTVEAVLERLKQVSTTWQPLPPSFDGDLGTEANDESPSTVRSPGMFPIPSQVPRFSSYQLTFGILLLLVEMTSRQGIRQLETSPVNNQAVSASVSLMKVANLGTSQDINQVLTAAFEAEDYLDCINNLRERNIDPLSYINSLDRVSSCLVHGRTLGS